MNWLIPVVALLGIAAMLAWRFLVGRRVPGYFAITEYWVYTDQTDLPPQEKIMDRMISANPHKKPGFAPIGAREGMLFSDIRLHLGLAKREKNPHIFRPDLFQDNCVPSPEVLALLPQCQSMVKLRYASETPLKDTRHLQFMPHLADTVSDLLQGKVVYDRIAEKIWSAEEFRDILDKNPNVERPDSHVRVVWTENEHGCFAETLGLRKVGLAELKTDPQEKDNEVLVTGLMIRLAFHLVRTPEDQGPFEFEEFGDVFILTLGDIADAVQTVHLTRRQELI